MASGWGDLGAALAGGGQGSTQAYQKGKENAARLGLLLAQAQKETDERVARDQLQTSISGAGYAPEQANLLATALRGGFDPTKISGYAGDVQEQGFRGASVADALAGNWGGANANLMGVANGPVELASVQGQNLINNRLLPGGGGISTTEQGRSAIATDAAQAAASRASAANSYASAARTRQSTGNDALQFALERTGQWNPGGKPSTTSDGKPLSAPTINKLASDADKLANTNALISAFQGDFAGNGTGGDLENLLGRMGWQGGMTGATPGQADWWQRYDRQKNVVRNELFGAALTPGEEAAFDKADINPNMSAETIRTNLGVQAQTIQQALQRQARTWQAQGYNANALREATGLQDFGSGSLSDALKGGVPSRPTPAAVAGQAPRAQVRTGTANGRRVVQYSDGSTEYAD
jgi:hypothetical protein